VSDVRDEAWVRSQAMGALSWLTGYTEPPDDTDEIQYKISDVSERDDEVMTISVEPADLFDAYYGDQPVRYFTIDVVVRDMAEPS
jgi:hypothetical protein